MVFLMYHELELVGRTPCQTEPGYVRYVLAAEDFAAQMRWLKDDQWRGLNVSEALKSSGSKDVVITFDDGCETDLLVAAPLLQQLGFQATFYITLGFLDTAGFLSIEQVRQLSANFEIGCHSMTHAYLTDVDDTARHREIAEAKISLEQLLGRAVEHFSCPGGRYDERVAKIAHGAGYRTVATSRPHANRTTTNPLALGRVAITRGTRQQEFEALCRGEGLWRMNLQDTVRRGAMELLGNGLYDRVRATLLRERSTL